tara:strand:+ start:243 stop:437 length:195 start_codon:yes stop_codon:yes gene_type:complete
MNRKVKVSIAFEVSSGDLELIDDDYEMTDEELIQYAKNCFQDDIYSFVYENDLIDYITAELIND